MVQNNELYIAIKEKFGTITSFCESTGLKRTMVCFYLHLDLIPSEDKQEYIAKALDKKVEDLFPDSFNQYRKMRKNRLKSSRIFNYVDPEVIDSLEDKRYDPSNIISRRTKDNLLSLLKVHLEEIDQEKKEAIKRFYGIGYEKREKLRESKESSGLTTTGGVSYRVRSGIRELRILIKRKGALQGIDIDDIQELV